MPLSFPLSTRLAAFYFAYFAYIAGLVAYLPLYLAERGLDAAQIALVVALPQLARTFAPAAWGWVADHTGAQRGIVVFSCAVTAACFTALPHVHGVAAIAAAIGAMSVLSAGALPLVEAIALGSLAGNAGRYGPIRLWGSVSFIGVVLAGGAWLDFGPVQVLPALLAGSALSALVCALLLPRGTRRDSDAPTARVRYTPAVASLLGAGFCMALAHGVLYAFLTLHLQRAGYGGSAIGLLWTLGVLAEIFVFALLPAIFRRFALAGILIFGFGCAVARFLAIAWLADVAWILGVAQLLHAATFGAFHAASVALVQRVFRPGAHARGQTLFASVSHGAGGAAGALIGGWAWEAGGPAMAFSAGALAALAGAYFACQLKRAGL